MREVRALQKRGLDIQIISIWKPGPRETKVKVMAEWGHQTYFLLAESIPAITHALCVPIIRSPTRFLSAVYLAFTTARPGWRGTCQSGLLSRRSALGCRRLTEARDWSCS